MEMQRVLRSVSQRAQLSYPTVYRNLMAVGLMGTVFRRREDADIVNAAVEATLSNPTNFRIYRALAQGMAGDASYAVQTMNERIDENPDDDLAKVVLGIAKMLAGEPDWRFSIDNVLAVSADQVARETALNVLDYLQQLKKRRS